MMHIFPQKKGGGSFEKSQQNHCQQLEICKSVCMFIILAIVVETD